jgi:hypothetical protein
LTRDPLTAFATGDEPLTENQWHPVEAHVHIRQSEEPVAPGAIRHTADCRAQLGSPPRKTSTSMTGDASRARPRAGKPEREPGGPAGRSSSPRLRDNGGIVGLRSALLVLLAVVAAALSACGSSSTSSSLSTSSTATSTTAGSGSGVATAEQKCLDATQKIQDSSARSTAEHACNQITTSNANVSTALSKAKQACSEDPDRLAQAGCRGAVQQDRGAIARARTGRPLAKPAAAHDSVRGPAEVARRIDWPQLEDSQNARSDHRA